MKNHYFNLKTQYYLRISGVFILFFAELGNLINTVFSFHCQWPFILSNLCITGVVGYFFVKNIIEIDAISTAITDFEKEFKPLTDQQMIREHDLMNTAYNQSIIDGKHALKFLTKKYL